MICLVLDELHTLFREEHIKVKGDIGVRLTIAVALDKDTVVGRQIGHRSEVERNSRAVVLGPVQQAIRSPEVEVTFQCARTEQATAEEILSASRGIGFKGDLEAIPHHRRRRADSELDRTPFGLEVVVQRVGERRNKCQRGCGGDCQRVL
jgi:hypothetical protein